MSMLGSDQADHAQRGLIYSAGCKGNVDLWSEYIILHHSLWSDEGNGMTVLIHKDRST